MEVTDFNMQYWVGNTVDAYYTIELEGDETIPGDLNGDGAVDILDLAILLSEYGCAGDDCRGDIDGDNDVDLQDLALLLSNYGEGAP